MDQLGYLNQEYLDSIKESDYLTEALSFHLLERGIEIPEEEIEVSENSFMDFIHAVMESNLVKIKQILDEDPSIHFQDLLTSWVNDDRIDLFVLLLDYVDLNEALILAVIHGNKEMILICLEKGANLYTSLKYAVLNGNLEIILFLLDQGVKLDGYREWAELSDNTNIMKLF